MCILSFLSSLIPGDEIEVEVYDENGDLIDRYYENCEEDEEDEEDDW